MAHDYRGNNIMFIPITAVIPIMLSPFPQKTVKCLFFDAIPAELGYRGYRGFPAVR